MSINRAWQEFLKNLRQERFLKPGDSALLAVSGGADSMAMLHLFHRLSKKWNLELAVGHVNHNLRGKASRRDLEFVEKWAQTLNFPFFSESVDVRGVASRRRFGMEEAARELRYRALEKMAHRAGCEKIATAHTLQDQAETVLMRILRGTGLSGLAGIRAQRVLFSHQGGGVLVVRPLLTISREDLRAALRRERIPFREDASNKSPRYLRNVIRRKAIPLLENISPRLQEHLARLASSAASLCPTTSFRPSAPGAHPKLRFGKSPLCGVWSKRSGGVEVNPFLGYNKSLGCEILKRVFPEMGYSQVQDLWRRINSGKGAVPRILG